MFSRTLTEVDRLFPNKSCSGYDEEHWRENQRIVLDIFNEEVTPLVEICHSERFPNLLEESTVEQRIWPSCGVSIIEFRIRPQSNYYTTLKKEMPWPDNPEGCDATGIQLSISILRTVSGDKLCYPASVDIRFEIWGNAERKAFILFYKNYRRPFELLLRALQPKFMTACYFENLNGFRNKDLLTQLDLYLANKEDPEACFSFEISFNRNATFNSVLTVFERLLIIYYCCFGYCKRDKELDRILDFIDDLS